MNASMPKTTDGARAARAHARPRTSRPHAPLNAELVHELEVHQVEREMRNEELRRARLDLAAVRDRYVDLYDLAPVGYFTLDAKGLVTKANLTGAARLDRARQSGGRLEIGNTAGNLARITLHVPMQSKDCQ